MKKILMTFAAVILLSGCTTLGDARIAKGSGMKRVYDAPYEKSWKAAVCSLNALGLSIATENKPEGHILAQRGMTAFSYGENVAVFVTKVEKSKTEIEVVSKKAMQTNIFAPNWSTKILDGVEGCL